MSRYHVLKNDEIDDHIDGQIQLTPFSDHDDDNNGIHNPSRPAFLKPKNSRRCWPPPRTCIVISITVLVLLLALVTGGGIWVYRTEQADGQSPPWYPTPRGGTVRQWQESYKKAQALIERMSLVEKVNITTGTGWTMDLCVGNTGPATNAGFPSLCLQDGPLGLRFVDNATSFPAGITVGSTWNRDLMRRRGAAHGREAKLKGINTLLGPAMGPIGRNPAGGRNWEGFGADPVLQAIAAYETILGIQSQGVMATAKHYIGNEQEHFRKSFEWGLPEGLSSNIDDRTMHEVYAWPFAESVRAGVASVMCSYQMVNNSYACANSKLLNGILKDELGFQGFVQSDWLAQRSGVASALAGLDMTMPGDGIYWQDGKSLFGKELTIAVLNRSVPLDRINDMVSRIVAAWYQLGQDTWDTDGPNFSSWTNEKVGKLHEGAENSYDRGEVNKYVYAPNDESITVAREVAAEGTVLLKNEGVLPLDSAMHGKVMIIGEDAGSGNGPNACEDRGCNQGTLAVGWGSGATEFMYLINPLSAINDTLTSAHVAAHLTNRISSSDSELLGHQDLCLVFVNADAGEGYLSWGSIRADRNDLSLQKEGSKLVKQVADACGGPTIVVIHSVGAAILEEFVDHPNVKAILHANLPGQESGFALVDVLFGNVDASGRLAFTIGRSLDDYGEGAKILYYPNQVIPQVDFDEGLYIDYRHFDKYGIQPRYPFGYGLSYTTFELADLEITVLKPKSGLPASRPASLEPPFFDSTVPDAESALFPPDFRILKKYLYPYISNTKEVKQGLYPYPDGYDIGQPSSAAGGAEGGNPSLYEPHVRVRVQVTNTGSRTGKEVVQLYVKFPDNIMDSGAHIDTPVKVLRNFEKIELHPQAGGTVEMNLTRKDLSYWSVVRQNWIMPEHGDFTIMIGRSSQDIALQGRF